MRTESSKIIWLVGASQGIGLSLCQKLLEQGHQVIASSRSAQSSDALQQLQQDYSDQLQTLNLDVQQSDQVESKCKQAWQCFGGIDTWIYNVGSYEPLTCDQWDFSLYNQMTQTNYLGAVALMIALKPYFFEQGHGQWIWNISLASDFGLPYSSAYSAPKAALMNLAESIQPELEQHNLQLQVINHGFVKTRLTAKNDFPMLGLMEAEQAADKILHAMSTGRFEIRFPWNLSFILTIITRLPKSWALKLTAKALKKTDK